MTRGPRIDRQLRRHLHRLGIASMVAVGLASLFWSGSGARGEVLDMSWDNEFAFDEDLPIADRSRIASRGMLSRAVDDQRELGADKV